MLEQKLTFDQCCTFSTEPCSCVESSVGFIHCHGLLIKARLRAIVKGRASFMRPWRCRGTGGLHCACMRCQLRCGADDCFMLMRLGVSVSDFCLRHRCICSDAVSSFSPLTSFFSFFLQTDDDHDSGTESDDESAEIEELQKCEQQYSCAHRFGAMLPFVSCRNPSYFVFAGQQDTCDFPQLRGSEAVFAFSHPNILSFRFF